MADQQRPVFDVARANGGVPVDVAQAELAAGFGGDRRFSPGMPLQPADGYSRTPRSHDFQTGYNIAARPRRNERVSFDTLKGLIDSYDVAQMCIWHRIDSLKSLAWSLVPKPGFEGQDVAGAVELGTRALSKPDRRHGFKTWLGMYAYDVLAYDAGALYRMRNNAGRAIGLKVIDGTTLAPLLDVYGDTPMAMTPGDPAPPAYVQYVQGLPWNWLTTDDVVYEPFRKTSASPYGKAPIESILLNANTDMRFQVYFLQRFTEGNIPEGFAESPEGWSPDQIKEFQDTWDAFLLGDQSIKQQIKWVPHGTKMAWSNEKAFEDTFSLFLMRKTAAAFHVTPQDLGFTEDVNRATSETQVDNQFRIGDLPLIEHIQGVLDSFVQDDLGLPLCFQFDTGQEKEDRLATAQADKIYIESGVIGASEVRERVYGLPEPGGQVVPRFVLTNRAGPIPLSALFAVAGPVDPATGAPVPGAALPRKPFAPVEGTAPQKLPNAPALAVQRYPEDNPQAADAAVQQDLDAATPVAITAGGAPVAKAEAAAGLASDNVPTSFDLDRADEDGEADVVKAAELASFRRFVRARRRAGKWRNFEFTAVSPVAAHRLNNTGRAEVRKAEGQLIAAGLAVLASDTGRVLMLQRALEDGDPAGGCWEFPGGHIEDGESPIDAAIREWCEETGCVLPVGETAGAWIDPTGVYRGFVWRVASESLVDLGGRSSFTNPDDPDGDRVEAIAWWAPSMLPVVQAVVRPELVLSLPQLLRVLGEALDRAPAAAVCPCGTPVAFDAIDGWQHADGSISHEDGESVSDKMAVIAKAGESGPKA